MKLRTVYSDLYVKGTYHKHMFIDINLFDLENNPKANACVNEKVCFSDKTIILDILDNYFRKVFEKYNNKINDEKRLLVGIDLCILINNNLLHKNFLEISIQIQYSKFRGKEVTNEQIKEYLEYFNKNIKTFINYNRELKDVYGITIQDIIK